MQISRHWRMNSLRYRLQGVRLQNGQVSIQGRELRQEEKAETNGEGTLASALFRQASESPVTMNVEGGSYRKETK